MKYSKVSVLEPSKSDSESRWKNVSKNKNEEFKSTSVVSMCNFL